MKKVVLIVLALCFSAAASFAEFNLKTSYDFSGTIKAESGSYSSSRDVNNSVTLSGDYLRNINQFVKIGGGFEFVIPRTYEKSTGDTTGAFLFMPLYFTVQVNPLPMAPEVFVKGNIGYNILFAQADLESGASTNCKMYYAASAGYEFPFGLLFDLTYAVYQAKEEWSTYYYKYSYDLTYTRVGVNIGYKFGRPRR